LFKEGKYQGHFEYSDAVVESSYRISIHIRFLSDIENVLVVKKFKYCVFYFINLRSEYAVLKK